MNDRERVQRLLPIIEAYAQGQTIQLKVFDKWCDWPSKDVQRASFDGRIDEYRIKPQPREIFIAEHNWRFGADAEDRIGHAYLTPGRSGRWCKFREVLE